MELRLVAGREGRLSSFLQGELKMSGGLINRLKWKGGICVNGCPQWNSYQVRPGDVITVALDEPAPEYPAQDGPVDVIYEDEHLLAVDKPAGMLIHPSRAQNEGTLANYVAGYFEKTGQKSAFHPVTRLDRDTFGIVLLAKNSHVHGLLQAGGFQNTYHALVYGGPAEDRGRIDAPIARRPLPSLLREVREDGKPSATDFQVLERGENLTWLELMPVTGRTHQLRVHCAYAGYPILGDPQYGSEASVTLSQKLNLTTQELCAYSLELTHPITGKPLVLQSHMDVKNISRNA